MWIISKVLRKIVQIPQQTILFFIRLYQQTISPDHGWFRNRFPYGYCKFSPSCSEYGYQSIIKYGFLRGGVKAIWRIVRCNPWSKGGDDSPN